jgi:hypothetical protein
MTDKLLDFSTVDPLALDGPEPLTKPNRQPSPSEDGVLDFSTVNIDSLPNPGLSHNLRAGLETSPAEAQRQRSLSQRSGLPVPLVQADDGGLEKMLKAQELERKLLNAPYTTRWMDEPMKASIAADSVDILTKTEDNMRRLASGVLSVYGNLQQFVDLVTREASGAAASLIDRPIDALFGTTTRERKNVGLITAVSQLADGVAEALGFEPVFQETQKWLADDAAISQSMGVRKDLDIGVMDVVDDPTRFGGFLAQMMAGSAAETALSILAMPVAFMGVESRLAEDRAHNDGRKEASLFDLVAVMPEAAAVAFLDRLGGKAMFGLFDEALKGTSVTEVLKSIMKSSFKEMGTEAIQEPLELLAGTLGTKKGVPGVEEFGVAALGGAMGGFGMGGAIRSVTAPIEARARAQQADERVKMIREINNADVDLRNKAPDLYADYQGGLMRDAGVDSVRVSQEGLVLLQEQIDNPETDPALRDSLRLMLEDKAAAAVAGDGVDLKPEEFWALPQETINTLAEHVALHASDYSAAEAKEIAEITKMAAAPGFMEEVQKRVTEAAGKDELSLEIEKQLMDTGGALAGDPAAARAAAQQMSAAFATLAERSGISLDVIKKRFMPRIQKEDLAVTGPLTYEQVDRRKLDFRDVTKRVPGMAEAAAKRQRGEITPEEYQAEIDKLKTVLPFEFVPEPATDQEMFAALAENKRDKLNKADQIPVGHRVGLRLDIPAYTGSGVWVPTIHNTPVGNVHVAAAKINNVDMTPTEGEQRKAGGVSQGAAKAPFARIDGDFVNADVEAIVKEAQAALEDPAWTQVGYDPERHSFFYDRATGRPVLSADEVLQVGPLVLAKNAQFGEAGNFLFQAVELRSGEEKLEISGKNTLDIARALETRTRAKYGTIERNDRSDAARDKIAGWMMEEVLFEMRPGNEAKSGVGWYSWKFQQALDNFGQKHAVLVDPAVAAASPFGTTQNARNFLTALIAVTSDGQKVAQNFLYADRLFTEFLETGTMKTDFTFGGDRNTSIRTNVQNILDQSAKYGFEEMHTRLLAEDTITNLKKAAKAEGMEFNAQIPAAKRLPLASIIYGPKLGSFYANLMGSHGYLTMDRWWTRTINRYRGTLSSAPTRTGLDRLKELVAKDKRLNKPAQEISDDEVLSYAAEYANSYKAKKYKNGTEIEKAANTIWKAANGLNDQPFNTSDRGFMIDAVARAQELLREQGLDVSIADIQAILWYYEKRLYAELGARATADISYAETAKAVVAGKVEEDAAGDEDGEIEGPDGQMIAPGEDKPTDPMMVEKARESAWKEGQRGFTLDSIYAVAEQHTKRLHDIITEAARTVEGATPLLAAPKDRKTAEEKLVRKDYDGPHRITDIVRSGISLATAEGNGVAVQSIIDQFGAENVIDQGWTVSPAGYASRSMLVRFEDGVVGEIQILTEPMRIAMWPNKDGGLGGHELYEEARALPKGDPRIVELEYEQAKLYLAAASEDPLMGALVSAGILDSEAVGNSVAKAAAEIGFPLDTTSARWTSLQDAAPLDVMAYALAPTSTAGRPSQSINSMASSPSTQSVPSSATDVQYQKARGSIDFRDMSDIVIRLYQAENLSTFLHESGHLYLEMLAALATDPSAPAQLQQDWQAVLDWMGVKDKSEITPEMHEKWAETYEAYLRQGKAPSTGLKAAFDKFTAWLTWIYKSISQIGGGRVELTPEIQEVMDRLLATDREIEEARQLTGMTPAFKSAEEMGLTEEEYAAYRASYEDSKASQQTELVQETFAEVQRETTKWWNDELEAETNIAMERLETDPVWIARAALQHDTTPSGAALPETIPEGLKLSSADAQGRQLPGGTQLIRKTGTSADGLAEIFGYSSGDELLTALEHMPRDAAGKFHTAASFARQQAEKVMRDRHGDLRDPATMASEALLRVHSARQADVLEKELLALAKLSNQSRTVNNRILRAAAARIIAGKRVGDIESAGKYLNAERRAGLKAAEAIAKGDTQAAFEHKMQQILNFHLYRNARDANVASEKMIKRLRDFQKRKMDPKTTHPIFIQQLKELVGGVNLRGKMTEERISRMSAQTLNDWAKQQSKDFGASFHIAAELEEALSRPNVQSMTMDELTGLHDTAVSIYKQGRRYAQAEINQFKSMVTTLTTSIRSNARKISNPVLEPDWADGIKEWGRQYMASMRTMSSLAIELDGGERGAIWTATYQRIKQADDRYQDRSQRAGKELQEILSAYTLQERMGFYKKKFIPEVGQSMSLNARLAVALNMGNAGNALALENTFSPEQVMAIASTLTSRDWDVVEKLWTHVDQYWGELADLEERTTGVRPKKVDPSPFTVKTADGKTRKLAGGYYPLVGDPRLNAAAKDHFEHSNSLEGFREGGRAKANTKHGSTIERTGFGDKKVWLDLGVLFSHVDGVLKDIELREAVLEVDRILNNKDFIAAVQEAKGGSLAYHSMMKEWLKNTVQGAPVPVDWLEKSVNYMRTGASLAEMGLSLRTMLQQPLGLTSTIALIGEKYTAIGVGKFMAERGAAVQFVMELSPFMRNRGATFNRDVRDAQRMMGAAGLKTAVVNNAFKGIQYLDMAVSIPTWIGAFEQAVDQMGDTVDLQRAVDIADDVVSRTQGTGLPRDLSNIQSGGVWKRLFTMFYSYFNAYHNLQSNMWKDARRTGSPAGWMRFARQQLWVTIIPALATAFFFGDDPKDDKWQTLLRAYGGAVVGNAFAGLVGLRDVANSLVSGFDYQISPAQNVLGSIGKAIKQIEQGEVDGPLIKSLLMMSGYLLHLPGTRQAARGVHYLMEEGSSELDTFEGWWRLLVTGPKRD